MPYFIYKIVPPLNLAYIDRKEKFREARSLVRSLREGHHEIPGTQFRMIFAKNEAEAEKLLSTPRDDRVIGED
jgi:hypothetical protein